MTDMLMSTFLGIRNIKNKKYTSLLTMPRTKRKHSDKIAFYADSIPRRRGIIPIRSVRTRNPSTKEAPIIMKYTSFL